MALATIDMDGSAARPAKAKRPPDGNAGTFAVERREAEPVRPSPRATPSAPPAKSVQARATAADRSRAIDLMSLGIGGGAKSASTTPGVRAEKGPSGTEESASARFDSVTPDDRIRPSAPTGSNLAPGVEPATARTVALSAGADPSAASPDSADEAEAGDVGRSDVAPAPAVTLLPIVVPPPPTLVPQGAAPPQLGQADRNDAGSPEDVALTTGPQAVAGALASAEASGVPRIAPRPGRGDAAASGDRPATTDEETFAATLAPVTDASSGAESRPVPPLAAPATGTAAAAAPAPGSPTQAPIPLGAVPMTIGLRSLAGINQFEIRLDPKDLGRIDVNLAIDKDTGTVRATLVVDRPETLALLQRDAGDLRQALVQAGLDAPDGSISLNLRGDGAGGASPDGSGSGGHRPDGPEHPRRPDPSDPTFPPTVPLRLFGAGRGLDIRI